MRKLCCFLIFLVFPVTAGAADPSAECRAKVTYTGYVHEDKGFGFKDIAADASEICALAANALTATGEDHFYYGGALLAKKAYGEATEAFEKAAAAGDIRGHTGVGLVLLYQNKIKDAVGPIKTAAEKGDALAIKLLAAGYQYGYGVEKSLPEAVRLLTPLSAKTLEGMDTEAKMMLGKIYEYGGDGVPIDLVKAWGHYVWPSLVGNKIAKEAVDRVNKKRAALEAAAAKTEPVKPKPINPKLRALDYLDTVYVPGLFSDTPAWVIRIDPERDLVKVLPRDGREETYWVHVDKLITRQESTVNNIARGAAAVGLFACLMSPESCTSAKKR